VGGLGFEDDFFRVKFFSQELGELLKHGRRIGLAVIDDAQSFSFERFETGHERAVFRVYHRSRVKKLDRCHAKSLSVAAENSYRV
jgi:hypothetical protein